MGHTHSHNAQLRGGQNTCSICLEALTPENTRQLPFFGVCGHHKQFHDACIQQWSQSNNQCPLCREPIQDPQVFATHMATRSAQEERERFEAALDALVPQALAEFETHVGTVLPPHLKTYFFTPFAAEICTYLIYCGQEFNRVFDQNVDLIRAQYPPSQHDQLIEEQQRQLTQKRNKLTTELENTVTQVFFDEAVRCLRRNRPERCVAMLNRLHEARRPYVLSKLQDIQEKTGIPNSVMIKMQAAVAPARARFTQEGVRTGQSRRRLSSRERLMQELFGESSENEQERRRSRSRSRDVQRQRD